MKTLHFLVVDPDGSLASELSDAARGLKGHAVVLSSVSDLARGADLARDRGFDVIVVPAVADAADLRSFAARLRNAGLSPWLIGVYRRDQEGVGETSLLSALRADVRDFLRRPVSSTELADVIDRFESGLVETRRGEGRVISFVSNKGGIGKSTLAISLASVLARTREDRVLLVDASLQLGVAHAMLDLVPERTIVDAARERDRLDETLLTQLTVRHDCGLRVLAAPIDAVEAAEVDDRALGRVLTVAKSAFDYVIVDTFPMIDAIAVTTFDRSDRLYVVTGSAVPHVVGAAKLLSVLARLAIPRERQRVILNETHPSYSGRLKPEEIAERLDRDLDHVFPFDKSVLIALDTGEPYALRAHRWFGFGKALSGLCAEVAAIDSVETRVEVAT